MSELNQSVPARELPPASRRSRYKRLILAVLVCGLAGTALAAVYWVRRDRPDPEHRLEVLFQSLDKFDPIGTDLAHESTLLALVHDRLLHDDHDLGRLVPGLAETWTSSADAKTWTFRLRKAATPNGVALSAEDVAFSYKLYLDKDFKSSAAANLMAEGKPVACRVVDDRTVEFSGTCPIPHFPWAVEGVTVFPRSVYAPIAASGTTWREALGPTAKLEHLAGFGPYHVSRRTPNQIDLVRNPNFWGVDADGTRLPRMDAIRLTLANDPAVRKVRFKEDARFLFAQPDALERREYESAPGFRVLDLGVDGSTFFLWLNQGNGSKLSAAKRALFRNEQFRRALGRLINRDEIIDQVFHGQAVPLYGPVSPAYPWAAPEDSLKAATPGFDPERAKAELAALGLVDTDGDGVLDFPSDGGRRERLTIHILTTDATRKKAVELVVNRFRAAGIDAGVGLEKKEDVVYRIMGNEGFAGSYDYTCLAMFLEGSSHPGQSASMYQSTGRMNFFDPPPYRAGLYVKDPAPPWQRDVDRLYATFATSPDPAAQAKAFNELQRAWVGGQPIFYLCSRKSSLVLRTGQWELTGHARTGNAGNPVLARPFAERVRVERRGN